MAQTVAPDAFEEKLAEIAAREEAARAGKAMWRTHHHPEGYDRCVVIAGRHWCRRCLTLYPVAFLVAALSVAGVRFWPESLDLWFIWLPCIPATLDFVLEQVGAIRYSARRQFLTTLLFAPALGRGLGYELDDSWSWEFWGPVLCFCTIWFFAAIAGHVRSGRDMQRGSDPVAAGATTSTAD